jgi:hypothetical protein
MNFERAAGEGMRDVLAIGRRDAGDGPLHRREALGEPLLIGDIELSFESQMVEAKAPDMESDETSQKERQDTACDCIGYKFHDQATVGTNI